MPRHEIVVSTENNPYMVWQAMLFHFSCIKYLGRPPVVMVHKCDEPLLHGFERIRATGGIVQTAPGYRYVGGVDYPARNTAGSLRHVQTDADFIVLCDPDMIFLQPFSFDDLKLTRRQISFDFVGYLVPDSPAYQPTLDNVCRIAGISPERLRQPVVNGGVPHVMSTVWQQQLSEQWFELMELFPTIMDDSSETTEVTSSSPRPVPKKDWLATMWAVVMAMHRLKLEPVMTRLCVTNYEGARPLPPLDAMEPKLLHYCYGDEAFNKRLYDSPSDADEGVWNVPAGDDTIAGTIRRHLREAREFFGIPSLTAAPAARG